MYEIFSWLPLTSEFHGAKMMAKIYKTFSYIINMQTFPCLHSQFLTAWILITANNGFLTGCTLECLTMLSRFHETNLPQKQPPTRTSEPGTSIFQLPEEKELRIKFASHPLQIRLSRGLKNDTNFRM